MDQQQIETRLSRLEPPHPFAEVGAVRGNWESLGLRPA